MSNFHIIHPIYQDEGAKNAFMHALFLTLATKGHLEIMDYRSKEEHEKIGVRQTLIQWGLLPPHTEREDVGKTGISVSKMRIHVKEGKVQAEIGKRLEKDPYDILVVATDPKQESLFDDSLTHYLAGCFRQTTLYIPRGSKPFVNENTGVSRLKKILLPVSDSPQSHPAFSALARWQTMFPEVPLHTIGFHAGEVFPVLPEADTKLLAQKEILTEGTIPSRIAQAARQWDADLVLMATNGRDSLTQKLIGSFTERVIRKTPCPVLSVSAV